MKEVVYNELIEALMLEKPSIYFEKLKEDNKLSPLFDELKALIPIEQNPKFHPEGSAWNHTMMVVDQAALNKNKAEYPMYFMIAALVHDFGKATKTFVDDKGVIRSIGHEFELDVVEGFLCKFTEDIDLIQYVLNMVKLHMRPNSLAFMDSKDKAYKKLFEQSVCINDLLLLSKADYLGRSSYNPYEPIEKKLQEKFKAFKKNEL